MRRQLDRLLDANSCNRASYISLHCLADGIVQFGIDGKVGLL